MNYTATVTLYAFFSLLAIITNLAGQRMILLLGTKDSILIAAILTGSILGLLVKYVLDRKWIFRKPKTSIKINSKNFFLYSITGIFTTAIFWFTEITFWYIWQTDEMRELGAMIGLCIGYTVKYNLDCRYVFNKKQLVF